MRKIVLAGLATVLAVVVVANGALADITISINGQSASFSPGPIERAGRVFVPLRGIFERLGASVVYANGTINATGSDGRQVSLHIGSHESTVNGQIQTLDVAPFVIGASTYVPLRFVSSALGASIKYDANNSLVAINTSGRAGAPVSQQPAPASAVNVTNEQPARNSSVQARRPTISADFSSRVDPNTVRVMLDGLDITGGTTRSQSGIVYAPPSPLQAGEHQVTVRGTDANGQTFARAWHFSTAGSAVAANSLTVMSPGNGTAVGSSFSVRGQTRPNARVHITAGAIANQIPGLSFGTGTYTGDTIADGSGNFSQEVSVNAFSGGAIVLTVVSTDAATRETAQQQIRLRVN